MVSQRVKEGGHPDTASHTTVGTILKGTKPVSWEALAAVVTELARVRELQAAPTEDEDPEAGETARLQAEMQACSRVRTLWLEVECHKDDGASESTKAARSFAWELHRLIVEPLGGDLARISRAIRALRVEGAPRLTVLADSLHGIVQGSRHPQPRDIDLLLELREHEGMPVLPDDREALERSYAEWLRCTSPAMYDLLMHHQNELKAAHLRAERWEGESRRLSAEKTRSEHGKAAEIQVFQARASADQSRLVARLKTVEAQNTELRQQLERAERKAAQLERARDALAAKAALQDTRDTVERAAEGLSAPYTSAAAVPPWDTMVPSAYVADFTSLYTAEPRSSADADYWSYDPYAGHSSYAYGADQASTRYGQWGRRRTPTTRHTRSLPPPETPVR